MKNRELAHQWAHQTRPNGSGSHFFFEGATLYSWGTHFPVARLFAHPITGAQCVLFTSRDYSNSTARHKYHARAAVSHLPIFYVDDVRGQATDAAAVAQLEAAELRRATERAEIQRKADERAAARAAKLRAKSPEILAEWLAGVRDVLPAALGLPVMLRRIGEDMETSKGARVPISDAARSFRFCERVRAAGWHRNGSTHQVGNYQLDAVNAAGIVAGCHRVSWEEAERFARSQGWEVAP